MANSSVFGCQYPFICGALPSDGGLVFAWIAHQTTHLETVKSERFSMVEGSFKGKRPELL